MNRSNRPVDIRDESGYVAQRLPQKLAQNAYPNSLPSGPSSQLRSGPQRRPTVQDSQPVPPALRAGPAQQPYRQGQHQQSLPEDPRRPMQRELSRSQEREPLQRQTSQSDQPPFPTPQLQRTPSQPEREYPPAYPPNDPYFPPAPAFARGPFTPLPSSDSISTVTSSRSDAMLIRGEGDDQLDKSDEFWKRFNNSVLHQQGHDAEKSSWLERNEGKSSRYGRWLWLVGLIIVLLAAGGIAIGVFISFHSNSNSKRPDTFGGSANITGAAAGVATTGVPATTAGNSAPTATTLHVSPTNTVA